MKVKILMNSYVILDNVLYNVNFYTIIYPREAGLGNSVFRYLLTDMTKNTVCTFAIALAKKN